MVDPDDRLYFPTKYSVGLTISVLVGHAASPVWESHDPGDQAV